jgi:hypothetical protein
MKTILALCSVVFLSSNCALASTVPGSNITISAPAEVPGMTLQPGTYSIRVVGKLTDRVILKVDDGRNNKSVDFIGIPNPAIKASPGVVSWSQPVDGTTYFRGWVPPGGSSMIEFVYPKAEAVSIATSNQAQVPAIDPASEGRNADPTLSREDMRLVTLWLLSSTQVGPSSSKPAIKAERYETASYRQPKFPIGAFPHTASSLPLIFMASLLFFAMAIVLRWRRLNSQF